MKKEDIIAELDRLGIPYKADAHWKTLEALLPAPAQSPESDTGTVPESEPAPAETPATSPVVPKVARIESGQAFDAAGNVVGIADVGIEGKRGPIGASGIPGTYDMAPRTTRALMASYFQLGRPPQVFHAVQNEDGTLNLYRDPERSEIVVGSCQVGTEPGQAAITSPK